MAAHSPVMRDVVARAKAGTPVLGICNGFQVLTETGLLPGVLMRNASLKFVCRDVHLEGRAARHPLHQPLPQGRGHPHPHRPRRRQLLRRRRDARPARGRGPRRLPLRRRGRQRHARGQPQRRAAQHRRHLRSHPAHPRHDAASRAPVRAAARRQRRPPRVRERARHAALSAGAHAVPARRRPFCSPIRSRAWCCSSRRAPT